MWMRINKNIMLAALLAVSSAAAQAQRLTSAKEIINVGRVEYRSPVTAEFEIKNVGNAEAHIETYVPIAGAWWRNLGIRP